MTPLAPPARLPPILCDRIVGNRSSIPAARLAGKSSDLLPLTWLDCTRRAFRKTTSSGREIAVLFPVGLTLSQGDVLYENHESYVVVEVRPCDLWLVTPPDAATLAHVALELGNLHVPVQVTPSGDLLTPPDGPTEGVLRRNGITYSLCHRRFCPLRATVTSAISVAKSLTMTSKKPAAPAEAS